MRKITALLVAGGLMTTGLSSPSAASAQLPLPLPGLSSLTGLLPGGAGGGSGGSGGVPGMGSIMDMLPNLGLPSPLNNCSFSATWSGFGAGCLPPQGPTSFLPSPLNGNCSFSATWGGIGGGCMPPPPPSSK